MEYYFNEGQSQGKKLLLLHGTGGDETSLVDIARFLDGSCTILSFRGDVQEDGMNRFFKRNGLNQFDIPSLEKETDNLLAEIEKHSAKDNVPLEDWILVGYSNGANIAAHLLLERKTKLNKAILFHPMSLGVKTKDFDLSDKKVWLSKGKNDPIVSDSAFSELVDNFEGRQAEISANTFDYGHQVSMDEINSAKIWLSLL
ncbi:alpha/beta hydrolase [Enterococcus sp. HY326]|uniref:alpha/beta hydrolase n=1 Tax=Enterococcus sp. HY326 TaxID=2971265 RepID=UPI00223F488A|nr:alpha/beta hydrolase [Enterococcus sp. HY326]